MPFSLCIRPLSAIIDSHYIIHHSFADDIQLQMSASPDKTSKLVNSVHSCICYIKAWATANMLRRKRTEHLHSLLTPITVGNAQILFRQSVMNFVFTLDCHLTMTEHVSTIAQTCYFVLPHLVSVCRFLTNTATASWKVFVLSRIDYCNSLLFSCTPDLTSHLYLIQNFPV